MKKTISLILCFLMLISIVPVSASAADEKVGGVRAVANKIHNVSGTYMPEFTTLKVLDPSGADTGYMPVASYLYTQKSASSYNTAYQLKTAPEEGVTYYAYIQIPTSTGGNDVNASLVKIEITGYDIKYTGMNFSGSNLYINYTIRKTARVCGVEAEASGVKYDSTLDKYAPEFTKLESVMANGSATGYDANTGALYESYNAGTWGNKLTTAPVEGATYYSYIDLDNPLGVHYVEDSLVDIEINGYDVEFIGAFERDMGFRIQVVYKLTKISRVCGVDAEASGVEYNSTLSGYAPVFTTLESLMSNGSVTGYNAKAGVLYKSYTSGTWGEKLTTAPVEGATYYSYIDLDNPLGIHYIDEALVDIEINGYDVEYIGAFERDMGYRIQVVYSIRKTARVCGVEAEASGVEYNSSLSGYAPVFTTLESVMSNGSVTGYNAKTGVLYKSYTSGTWSEKLTTAPVDGASYYSYIDLQNPLGIHYIDEALVDIEINGYDVEFIGAFERDMGYRIQVVYKLTKIARVCGVKAEEGAVWYRTSADAYIVEFDKLTSIGTNGSATGYDVEAAALYKSYTAGILGDKLTTTPVDGTTYYSYIDLENPLGIYYIEDSLVDIEIPGYNVEFIGAYERDMGFRIQIVYKLTKQYTRVTGLKAVASGVQFNNAAGAYAPVFTTLNAIAANGTVQAYDVEGAVLYKSCSGTSFDDKLTTVPVVGEKYYSYIRFENPEGVLDIENALVNISVAGYEVEYIASYEGDMGFSVVVVYSLVHKTHTGGTATCTDKAKCTVCGEAYGSVNKDNHKSLTTLKAEAATCTKEGKTEGKKCTACGTVTVAQQTIAKLGHKEVAVKGKAATCTATGLTDGKKCSVCGTVTVAQQTIAKLGHKEVAVKGKAATCTATGLTDGKKCSVCDTVTVAQKTIAKLGHKEVAVKGKAATCTATGLTDGKKCSVCGTVTVAQKTIAKLGHKEVAVKGKAATCTKEGKTEGKKCSVCGKVTVKQATIAKKSHSYKNVTTKATLKKNGKIENKCTVCGKVKSTTTIYYPKTIKLSDTKYTYNGKAKKPSVTVKDSKGKALKKDTDYTVKYASGRKSTGKYTVTVTFKGKYSGTKKLTFNILPSKTSKITPTCTTTSIKASWKKVTGADGYKVELLNSKGKVVKTATTTKTAYTFKKLSKVTTYKVKVTAYKTIDKKKVYSTVSTTITTSTAPAKVTLSKVTAGKKTATPAWKTVSGASGYEVMYSTSSKFKSSKTATVKKGSSKKTTIKKLTKGKKYYFKVRAYKTVDGKKVYGAWSAVKNVKVK